MVVALHGELANSATQGSRYVYHLAEV